MKIKKLLLLSFLLPFLTAATAQEKHVELISEEACNCLTKLQATSGVGYSDFKSCLRTAMQNNVLLMYEEALSKVVNSYDTDSIKYWKGVAYGGKLGSRLDTALVYSCDVYYRAADSLRYLVFNVFNKDSVISLLRNFSTTHKIENTAFFEQRTKLNYLAGNYANGLSDAEKVLAVDANSPVALTVKGYSLEGLKRYLEAANVYYRIAALSGQNNYLVWAAIARRKSLETK